jgi:hypothetical protein
MNLVCFASYKKSDAIVLVGEFVEELLLESLQCCIDLAGDRNGLPGVSRGVSLDQMFQSVVIHVICGTVRSSVAQQVHPLYNLHGAHCGTDRA